MQEYTHPSAIGKAEEDPTAIDWEARQRVALVPFEVVDGRPVKPGGSTNVRWGRNKLWHWGEKVCADTKVTVTDEFGYKWLAMIQRWDDGSWALPGGGVDKGETTLQAAVRELEEEAGLWLPGGEWKRLPARVMPDPRDSGEAWMTSVVFVIHLGTMDHTAFPALEAGDDAKAAEWVRADSYQRLVTYLDDVYGGAVFASHAGLLAELLDG